jgi:hypothetical protein
MINERNEKYVQILTRNLKERDQLIDVDMHRWQDNLCIELG